MVRVVLEEAWDHDEPLQGIVGEVLDYCEEHLDGETRRRIRGYVG